MKSIIVLFLISLTSPVLAETSFDSLPVTGSDIAEVLELHPSDYQITKTLINFGSPKQIIFRYTSLGQTRDLKLPGISPSVTLLTYVPKDGGPIKPLRFWITGSGGAISSAFAFDTNKAKFRRSGLVDGIFTVITSDKGDFSDPEYTIKVLTSDKSAEQDAAANP
jgi:hypothetical protein